MYLFLIFFKYQSPACPWEVYICSLFKRRLAPEFLQLLMEIKDAYIFSNASAIVYEYYPYGNLLVCFFCLEVLIIFFKDLSNFYKKDNHEIGGLMITLIGIQLGQVLEQIHQAKIIHADVKPDNIMLLGK